MRTPPGSLLLPSTVAPSPGAALALAVSLCVAMAGCGTDDGTPGPGDGATTTDASAHDDGGGTVDGGGTDGGGTTTDDAGGGDAGGADVDAFVASDAGASGCGGGPPCEAPFACTAAGYCANARGVPAFDHVYVVIFENRSLSSVDGHAPYLNDLAAANASATSYVSVTHPSLPNYIAMTSGDFWGISCDCHPGATNDCNSLTCNAIVSSCDCPQDVDHLGNQLDAAGIDWRTYGEGMETPCNGTDSSSRHYAARHLPFLYYVDVFSDAARCTERVRDYGDFATDLASRDVRFAMITPNLCNDMHDGCGGNAITHGDDWAMANIPAILARPGFAPGGRDALFVVWDEEDLSLGNAPIPFIVVSPLARPMATTDVRYDHYSLLATWEDGLGLPRLANAATAPVIDDIWR